MGKREHIGYQHFPFCPEPLPKRQILDSSKLEEFSDDKFTFDENGRKSSKWVKKKHGGKRRNCLLRAISPFPQCFKRYVLQTCTKLGLVWERVKVFFTRVVQT